MVWLAWVLGLLNGVGMTLIIISLLDEEYRRK